MANLTVNNFLSIKKAVLELKRVTILIGPQAQGKSLITKLVSFFKDIPYMVYEAGDG
ncbi:AAA family ATPase [Pseudomonas mendocina]|nr:AAA family ATPase [Pseudomonas mendocina]